MKKLLVISFVFLIFQLNFFAYAEKSSNEIDNVLSSAESLFKAMKDRDYPAVWKLLTVNSKIQIVDDTYKSSIKAGVEYTKEQINMDFSATGPIANAYWNAFLAVFNPDMVIEQSKWEMGRIEKDKAEIAITHKNSEMPAVLKMFKEGGIWKVGLVETFWTRK